jgi:hypothetical protein
MSLEIPRRLPSLAHRLAFTPATRKKKDREELRCPPFPEIDLTAEGFCFSHFPWIGINANQTRKRLRQRISLAVAHEFCHLLLAKTSFSLLIKNQMFRILSLIPIIFEERQQRIDVPFHDDLPRNELEGACSYIVVLQEQSHLVEEVFAVRYSLLKVRGAHIITRDSQLVGLIDYYKSTYEEYIEGFGEAYEIFDLIANKIGNTAVFAMIYVVLETLHPDEAFLEIISELYISDKQMETLSKLSFEEAYYYFKNIIDDLDKDGSFYRRKDILDSAEEIEEAFRKLKKEYSTIDIDYAKDFLNFIVSTSDTFIICGYSKNIHPFDKLEDITQEVDYGNFVICLEAIRQQLTQGKGLLCPFWIYSPGNCCSSFNKAFFEKVWSCTSHNRSCNWKRMGCLNQ